MMILKCECCFFTFDMDSFLSDNNEGVGWDEYADNLMCPNCGSPGSLVLIGEGQGLNLFDEVDDYGPSD